MVLQGERTILCLVVHLLHVCLFLCLFSHRTCFVDSALKAPVTGVDNVTLSSAKAKTFSFATSPRPHSHRAKGDYKKTTEQQPIIFPEDDIPEENPLKLRLPSKSKQRFDPFLSCSKGSTICDKVEDYPKERLTEILTRSIGKSFQATVDVEGTTILFQHRTHINDLNTEVWFRASSESGLKSKDFLPRTKSTNRKSDGSSKGPTEVLNFVVDKIDSDTGITNRLGSVDEFLCQSTPKLMFPQAAENRDGRWTYVVNVNEFKQGVRAELCSQRGKECNHAENFPPNLSTRCVQKFIYRRLVAFNKENETMYNDNFKIPSCCVCAVTQRSSVDDSAERRSSVVPEPLPLSLGRK